MRDAAPETVDQIYESAFMPDMWSQALDGLANAVEGRGAALIVVGASRQPAFLNSPGYKPVLDAYFSKLAKFDNPRPQRHLQRLHHGFLADRDLSTPEELAVDPIYELCLRPNGVAYTAGTTIALPHGDMLLFDVHRSAEVGSFDRNALATLDAHRPHLARAALVGARLGLERARVAAQVLETLGLPGAVVTAAGKALAMNPLFDALAPRVVTRAGDRLWIADPGARAAFVTALAATGRPGRSLPIPGGEDGPAAILHVLPLKRSALDIFSGAAAFVVATSLTGAIQIPTAALSGLFDLSPTEGNVAQCIVNGLSIADTSKRLELTPTTVKSYLKTIFSKTGVHRQSQLVTLLARSTAFLQS